MVDYLAALKYPISNVKSFIIGAVITIFFWVLIPLLFINGYIVRIIRETNKGSEVMPEWDNWKSMILDGFYVSAIQVAYLIPALLFYAIAALTATQAFSAAVASNTPLDVGMTAIVFGAISLILMMLGLLVVPVAVIKFALTKDFKKAFEVQEIVKTILSSPLSYLINVILGSFVTLLFLLLTPLLSFVAAALLFYPIVFFYRLIAEWFTNLP